MANFYKLITDGSYNQKTNQMGLGIILLEPNRRDQGQWITYSFLFQDQWEHLAKSGSLVAEFLAAKIGIACIPDHEKFQFFTDNNSIVATLSKNRRGNRALQKALIKERDKKDFLSVHLLNDSKRKKTFSPRMKKAHNLARQAIDKQPDETHTIQTIKLKFGINL